MHHKMSERLVQSLVCGHNDLFIFVFIRFKFDRALSTSVATCIHYYCCCCRSIFSDSGRADLENNEQLHSDFKLDLILDIHHVVSS